jgi:tRNA (guanine-N7-)-methyltransferase
MPTIDDIIVEPPSEGVVVDPMDWYESSGPFELEIGCGKGGFLLGRARAQPHLRLLGIEWANKYFHFAADRMARWQLTNVRVMRADARFFVMHHLPPACVTVLHLYHPDPWPKKRHHKRRLIQPDFVEAAIRALAPGARWLIQSDHDEYFHVIRDELGRRPELKTVPWNETDAAPDSDWQGTNFEVKYAREGRRIHRAAYAVGREEGYTPNNSGGGTMTIASTNA